MREIKNGRLKIMNDAEFDKRVENQKWIFAKTYSKKSPHEYFMRKEDIELYDEITKRIEKEGETIMYFKTPFKCYIRNGKRYWGYDILVNRCDNNLQYTVKNNDRDHSSQSPDKNRKLGENKWKKK